MLTGESSVDISFRDWVRSLPYTDNQDEWFLSTYIEQWLINGGGLDYCFGNYAVYLQSVIAIVVAWQYDPSLLNYHPESGPVVERRPRLIMDCPGEPGCYDWMDEEMFAHHVFNKFGVPISRIL